MIDAATVAVVIALLLAIAGAGIVIRTAVRDHLERVRLRQRLAETRNRQYICWIEVPEMLREVIEAIHVDNQGGLHLHYKVPVIARIIPDDFEATAYPTVISKSLRVFSRRAPTLSDQVGDPVSEAHAVAMYDIMKRIRGIP